MEMMKKQQSKMSNVIDRSKMLMDQKIKKIENHNKLVEDKVKNANERSHKSMLHSIERVVQKENTIQDKIKTKQQNIKNVKKSQKEDNEMKHQSKYTFTII